MKKYIILITFLTEFAFLCHSYIKYALIEINGFKYDVTRVDPYEVSLTDVNLDSIRFHQHNNLIIPDDLHVLNTDFKVTYFNSGGISIALDTLRIPKYLTNEFYFFIGEDNLPMPQVTTYDVSDENQYYSSFKGSLYSKSFKTFLPHPYGRRLKYFKTSDFHPNTSVIEDNAFNYADSVSIPKNIKKINTFAFNESIKYLTIDADNPNYTMLGNKLIDLSNNSIINTFTECSVEDVVISPYLKHVPDKAFLSKDVRSLSILNPEVYIGASAFEKTKISKLEIPEGFKTISTKVFKDTPLTYLSLPSTLESIGDFAFFGTNLTDVTLPDSLQIMGISVFDFSKLTSITSLAITPPRITETTFYQIITDSAILYVPDSSIAAYKDAAGWKNFKNIRGISQKNIVHNSL